MGIAFFQAERNILLENSYLCPGEKQNKMKQNDWKSRLGVMYSTNPDYEYQTDKEAEEETLPKDKQRLQIGRAHV